MRRMLAAALIVAMAGAGAMAQPVPVRSGEHAGYSRLVFEAAPAAGWSLRRDADGYVLRFTDPAPTVDLDDIFRLIPRTRIADVRQDADGAVRLVVGCAPCHADAFEFRGRALVVDIRDGPPPPGSPFEGQRDVAATVAPDTHAPRLVAPDPFMPAFPGAILPMPWEGPLPDARRRPPAAAKAHGPESGRPTASDKDRPALAGTALRIPPLDLGQREPVAAGTVEAIARELARAASQGLVEVAPAPPPDPAVPEAGDLAEPRVASNIRVRTSLDAGFSGLSLNRLLTQSDPACLPDAALAIAGWGDEAHLGSDLGRYRGAMAAERERPDPASVEAAIRHYIYLTFGAEARALALAYRDLVGDVPLLLTLADIMDGHPDAGAFDAGAQASCPSAVALWALLAAPDPANLDLVATSAVVGTFSSLPLHIRRHLAPELSDRLRKIGALSEARAVIAAATRASGDPGDGVRLAVAELDPSGPDVRALKALQAARPIEAGRATRGLLESALDRDAAIDPAQLDTAAALAFELGDTAPGPDLTRLRIMGLLADSDRSGATAAWLQARKDAALSRPVSVELLDAILAALADNASDAELALAVLSLRSQPEFGEVGATTRIAVAARLHVAGLRAIAEGITYPGMSGHGDLRLARAEAALAAGEIAAARREIAGLPAAEVRGLAAEIAAREGRYDLASDAFLALGDQNRHLDEAIRARDWRRIADATDGPLSEAALMTPAAGETPDAALAAAGRVREAVTDLLEHAARN